MSASQEIILHDVPGRDGKCASPNAWKTRLLLNYKRLPYTTRFSRLENLQETLSQLGLPPNDPQTSIKPYTIPVVTMPSGEPIMDSRKIATAVDKLYPSPTIHLEDPIVARVEALYMDLVMPLLPVWMPRMPRNLLEESSVPWFYEQRRQMLGRSVDEMEAEMDGKGDKPWEAAKPGIEKLVAMLKERPEGPFFLGKELSYGDILTVSLLKFYQRVDQEIFDRVVAHDDVLLKQYEACSEWLQRED